MIKEYQNEIGDRLKKVRKFLHLTQLAVSGATGLSIGFVSEMENGKKRPSSIYLFYLASQHNANINYILTGKGDMIIREGILEHGRNIDFGKDREVIEEMLYYLERFDIARYSILSSFLKFKQENPDIEKQEE